MLKRIINNVSFKFRRYLFRTRLEAVLAGKRKSPIIEVGEKDRRIGKTTELAIKALLDYPSFVVEGTLQQKKYVQESLSKYLDEYIPVATPEELLHSSPLPYTYTNRSIRSKVKLYVDESVTETQLMSLVNAGYNVKVYLRYFYE